MSLYKEEQIGTVISRRISVTDFKQKIFDKTEVFQENTVPKYNDDGTLSINPDLSINYEEIPKDVLNPFVVKKLNLDISENCYLIINEQWYNPIYIRTGSLFQLDYEDVDITTIHLMKTQENLNKNNEIYYVAGLGPLPKNQR